MTKEVIYILLIICLGFWVFNLQTEIQTLEDKNSFLLVDRNKYRSQYDILYEATDCFYDGQTNWKDCVSFLSTYR